MAEPENESAQERVWGILHDEIVRTMGKFGRGDYRGRADYLVIEDNFGHLRHKIEIQNLNMLRPDVVDALRSLLKERSGWEIVLALDVLARKPYDLPWV